jgi:hypothetical protein
MSNGIGPSDSTSKDVDKLSLAVTASDTDSDDEDIVDRLATARRRIQPTDCLFCTASRTNVTDTISHMSREHSFFVPDRDNLVDLPGLLGYLGEKIVVGNICLYCPNGGREFGSLEAVRKHMLDKGHCKIAFDSDEDLAELSDFYGWGAEAESDEDWEDTEMGEEETNTGVSEKKVGPSSCHVKFLTSCRRLTVCCASCRWSIPHTPFWSGSRPSLVTHLLFTTISLLTIETSSGCYRTESSAGKGKTGRSKPGIGSSRRRIRSIWSRPTRCQGS